jgi:hypothetical protein
VRIDRALDPAERFFWRSDRVSCMNFVVFAELDGVVDAGALRAALPIHIGTPSAWHSSSARPKSLHTPAIG